MKQFFTTILAIVVLVMSAVSVHAQQLPDSGFEDWGGEQFDSKEQPKYWNYSNVEQLGVKRNFAHKTTGRSGNALKIQDQFVGVGSIGATSPGYVALGHPWAYVSSLTSIEDATAGTYGGIEWKHRPDSMVVWIKRYYDSGASNAAGDHLKDENFNLIFYSWSGESYAPSFKAKNLSCTDISNSDHKECCVDEESDIRQALDGNECGTKKQAKQIAEGWYYEKKEYKNWTRICVPIYYFNDDVPEKCNVILSAGNYPNFRANSGQYAGSSMDVDDISLIYSSKVQKLYIDNREWKGFNPNSTEPQTYSLGQGVTEMPKEIFAVRGAGSLTNNRGGKATFPGRRLTDSECVIRKGTVDGEPTTITVKAADGSSTTTYTIKFVSQTSDNARLSDIRVNGQSISGFNAYLNTYNVALPYGTTDVPVVDVTTQDATATAVITQATSTTGKATIVVTAGDGTTTMTYTVNFSVAALTDATLKAIYVAGSLVPGYQPNKSNYTVSLPLGTTAAPKVTWESAYAAGVQTIQLLSNTLDGGAQIQVSIPGSSLTKTYKLTYKIEASSYSLLAAIMLDGVLLEGFEPEKTAYTITLPLGTTTLPAITWTQGDNYQTVKLTEGGVDGLTRIEVTAANGSTTTYRLTFQTEKSTNNALAGISIDGTPLENFHPDSLSYTIMLPAGTTTLPAVTFTQGDDYQKVVQSVNTVQMTVRLIVTAGDGSSRIYTLRFEVEKSTNALLQMIYLNGEELEGFEPEKLDYSLVWKQTPMPKVTVLANSGQSVAISAPASYGLVSIVVTPEDGTPNTYTVRLTSPDEAVLPAFPTDSFPASSNASLAALYIGGEQYNAFKADEYNYTYNLPRSTYQVPAVVPVAAVPGQTILVEHGAVDRPTVIQVLAADKKTKQTYTILFNVAKSSNTKLESVEIDGASINFDPEVKDYTDIELPYGTTLTPSLTVERGEKEQSLVITEAPLGTPSTIVVTAEDGTQATYSFSYKVQLPGLANELLSIVIDGVGALDMEQAPNFTLDLPYGTASLDIVNITKNYPEQQVLVINGGIYEPTTITVKSVDPSEANKVYTITPNVYPYDPAILTDIKVGDQTINHFDPRVFNYVLSVNGATPEVTFTKQEGAEVDVDSNDKWVKLTVSADEDKYKHTYLITFFYPNDITFDMTFDNFDLITNNAISSEKTYCPKGWYAPIKAETSNPASPNTYYPSTNSNRSTTRKQGSYSAQLNTTFITTSAESMAGVLSLSKQTVVVGRWILGIGGVSSSTTFSFGEPIKFRNSPDEVLLDYRTGDHNKIDSWHFDYIINGEKKTYIGDYTAKNQWRSMNLPLSYSADFVPTLLDIVISSANTEVPNAFYTNNSFSGSSSQYTSEMLVDNMRFVYNSALKSLSVNGAKASVSGTKFSATLADMDYYGLPQLTFEHTVPDQMAVVKWGDEIVGQTQVLRTATITNYGEDLSSTAYTLTIKRNKSSNTACETKLDGRDLTIFKGSPYQTIDVSTTDKGYVVKVTAETGAAKSYTLDWEQSGSETTSKVTEVPADNPISGTSTARLVDLVEQPVVNYEREFALDSVEMIVTDTCYQINVYGADTDTTYTIRRNPSSNALLKLMTVNGTEVTGFYEQTYDYVVSLPSLDAFSATAQDENADVRYTVVPIDENNVAVFVLVTAADGTTQAHYSVLVRLHTLSSEAYLTSIMADEVELPGFTSTKYEYTIQLPAGSPLPTLSSIVCDGATVEMTTTPSGSSATVTFVVTSEDGTNQQTYTVFVHVLPSAICTLDNLFIGDEQLEGFSADQLTYSIELPYGTSELPTIDYVLTDKHSSAQVVRGENIITITVTAEDGEHTTVYTLLFTIAKSTNADLEAILLDGEALPNFFADEHDYTVSLPYGADEPVITAQAADENATVSIDGNTITVTAEDGVTTATYTLTFVYLPSTNALLKSILLDGTEQAGFAPDIFDYQDTVVYGGTMPVVTWLTADEQQQVDTVWIDDLQLIITVTAGDEETIAEYVITFIHLLSSNCNLTDLQVRGTTIEGFRSDSNSYVIVYPVGTDSASLCTEADITAIPEEATATVDITTMGTVIQVFVTAPDGTMNVYTIEQTILLSEESRLKMIWLDSVELRDFEMDVLNYSVVLAQGAMLPEITAQTLDSLAEWELGMESEIENGKEVELYCSAQDGSQRIYRLQFVYAEWAASSVVDEDDYLFYPIGAGQYKAVTIGIGIQVAVYDMRGSLQMLAKVPTASPADVIVDVKDGNSKLREALPTADGVVFDASTGQPYVYVFYDSKTKRVAKGGKFQWGTK